MVERPLQLENNLHVAMGACRSSTVTEQRRRGIMRFFDGIVSEGLDGVEQHLPLKQTWCWAQAAYPRSQHQERCNVLFVR